MNTGNQLCTYGQKTSFYGRDKDTLLLHRNFYGVELTWFVTIFKINRYVGGEKTWVKVLVIWTLENQL